MKLRYIVCIYVIFILLAMLSVFRICTDTNGSGRDMVSYNERLRQMEAEIQKNTGRREIESKFDCAVLYPADEDYRTRLNAYIKKQATVLDIEKNGRFAGKAVFFDEERIYEKLRKRLLGQLEIVCLILLAVGLTVIGVLYINFVAPFGKLKVFAKEIAKGNFEFPLPMQSHNFFGVFTESFDMMREELKRAKEREYEANRSKKELVAGLSHDIKTPLATIRATCEVLQLKEKNPDTLEKAEIITRKADMIDSLMGNMFQAALEELEVLKVEAAEESSLCIRQMFDELKFYGDIQFENEVPECLVYMDRLRLGQVIDNILNNAFKYAGTSVFIKFLDKKDGIQVRIKDRGKGVPEEELALLTEKYFRGGNTKGKAGSGLGLYLSKMFMEQMNGGMECYNDLEEDDRGFTVVLFLKRV